MDLSTGTPSPRPSGLPRPSRLPVPSASLRPSPSRENLQQSPRLSVSNPILRSTPSRDHLSLATPTRPRVPSTPGKKRESTAVIPRNREPSAGAASYTPTTQRVSRRISHDTLVRKPSRTFLGEGQAGRGLRQTEGHIKEDGGPILENPTDQVSSTGNPPRKPRPSLSERAIETLQNIPSSPAVRRRNSSFFSSDTPARPPSRSNQMSRPGSSHQADGSMRPPSSRSSNSRPNSSAGPGMSAPIDFRASTNTFRPPPNFGTQFPTKRPNTGTTKRLSIIPSNSPLPSDTSPSKVPPPAFSTASQQASPSLGKSTAKTPSIKSGSKTLSSRPLKPRASVNGLFRKPSMPSLGSSSNDIDRIGFASKKKPPTFSNTSSEGTSITSKVSSTTTAPSISNANQEVTPRKSSLALRDQIAKAKAAKRAAAKQAPTTDPALNEEVPVIATGTFDFGLSDDPFNQKINQNDIRGLLRKRIDAARSDGRLNIAAMGFKEFPEEVLNMYSLEAIGAQDGSWAEAVDLTRLVAADNEFQMIGDHVFPDIAPDESIDDEDANGNQFGGLETLDLHGNVLTALPVGLRRLELLTTLNLSNNKLGNDCFEVISQIPSLRNLRLGQNELSGRLDTQISCLNNLEVLDLQGNALTSLPDALAELVRLRVLNVRENSLTSLAFETLRQVPLIELFASKNKLAGNLIATEIEELLQIQILDISGNAITSLTDFDGLRLPSLQQLNCSSNRLTGLPDMSSWQSLLALTAEDNNIAAIPEGFVMLDKVKNVDFNGNNIKVLDDRIGAMDNLHVFHISGNPLRDRKFASMSTDEIKRALKARMAPPEHDTDKEVGSEGAFYSAPVSPISPLRSPSCEWPVKAGNILDRSNTQSHSLNPVAAAQVAASNNIRGLELHHNKFNEIPSSIAFFAATLTSLNLSHNELTSDRFLKDDLELPVLKDLNISSNTFNSLQPIIQHVQAPQLEKLDISFNRLTFLPALKSYFPSLITLFASHNTIKELSPESVKGLRTVDCSSNDISSLNPRIGLLGGPGGLERLDVGGNRFRVPKYTVLEKGTEATLTWLRDRIPANEISANEIYGNEATADLD